MTEKAQSILIILIAGIGDLVLASKSIRAIRNGNPDAEIHLLTSTQAAPLARNYGYIDYVWEFPIKEFRNGRIRLLEIWRLVLRLRRLHFDSVVNLYRICTYKGSIEMGLLFLLLGAREKIGHDNKGFRWFLDRMVPSGSFEDRHLVDAMMEMALLAGGVPDDRGIEVFWDPRNQEAREATFKRTTGNDGPLTVAMNPGGDRQNRRWSPDGYALVGDRLGEMLGAGIVLLGGPGEEGIAREIQSRMKRQAINLAGRLTLDDLVYQISRFDLLVTNDSGPMHIATAVKTPVVAIFGPEDTELFGPYTSSDRYRIVQKDVECRPCGKRHCSWPICLETITPEEVIESCLEMLEKRQINAGKDT